MKGRMLQLRLVLVLGVIVFVAVWRTKRFTRRMVQFGISEIDQMTGRQFEEYVGTLFTSQGYSHKYTPTTGDYGADLLLKKGQETIVVQATRYKQTVGVKAVQEVIPAIKMYNATAAWVVTNSTYTKQSLMLAKQNHDRMINRDDLNQMSIAISRNGSEILENGSRDNYILF